MLRKEKNYEFRKRMLNVNKAGMRDGNVNPTEDEFVIHSGMTVYIPQDEVVYTAAKDFVDFMYTSMETPVLLTSDVLQKADIIVKIDATYKDYKSYRIVVKTDGIQIVAHDARGAAQALFRLEDRMLTRHAPFLQVGVEERSPLYTPRMTHSGYGLDDFPNEHLLQIAKAGMDAILLFVSDVNKTPRGFWTSMR